MCEIVAATENDVSRIKQIIYENFDEVLAKFHSISIVEKYKMQNTEESLANQLGWKDVYVLKNRTGVIGTIALANLGAVEKPRYSISNLYIDVDEHRKTFGTQLVKYIINSAKERGIVHLHVPSSRNAVSFYGELGFDVDSIQPDLQDEITWMSMRM